MMRMCVGWPVFGQATPDLHVRVARGLLIALAVAIFVSTSATVILEVLAYLLFLLSPVLRARLLAVLQRPVAIALLALAVVIALGTLHGEVPWHERLVHLVSSRKLVLFFLAAAAFDDDASKRTFAEYVIWFCVAASVVSYAMFFTGMPLGKMPAGTVLRDYATQSMVFAVAAAAAGERDKSFRYLFAIAMLVGNIVFVTPGRVGYLMLLVLVAVLAVRSGLKKALVIMVACVALLAASKKVRDRIEIGFVELQTYEQSEHGTSMGWRVVMWKNTIALIKENPILGLGTGSFEAGYRRIVEGAPGWRAMTTNDPHNQYLRTWAEQGLPGLMALLTFMWLALRQKTTTNLGQDVLLAWCFAGLFASYFSRFAEGRFIFLWLGVMLSVPPKPLEVEPKSCDALTAHGQR